MKWITHDDLRRMHGTEGLIIQGCGGDLQEWVDGINRILTSERLLLDGTSFTESMAFKHDGVTCILFPFTDSVKVDIGRLAMWRLYSYGTFAGTWLSDFVDNELGGFLPNPPKANRPVCRISNDEDSVFRLMEAAAHVLNDSGMPDEALEMCHRIIDSDGYDNAVKIADEYVAISLSVEQPEGNYEEGPVLS